MTADLMSAPMHSTLCRIRDELLALPRLGMRPAKRENLINAPTSTADKSETEISNLIEQESPKHSTQIETDAERIGSSVARLTANSVDELEGLTSELQVLHS